MPINNTCHNACLKLKFYSRLIRIDASRKNKSELAPSCGSCFGILARVEMGFGCTIELDLMQTESTDLMSLNSRIFHVFTIVRCPLSCHQIITQTYDKEQNSAWEIPSNKIYFTFYTFLSTGSVMSGI